MSPDEKESDRTLLRRAAAGDARGFHVLYERYEPIVAGFLMRRTRDAELAADLTAETFASAILGARTFRGDGRDESALGWLLGIARNLLHRTYERGRTERRACARLGIERIELSDASLERVERLIDDTRADNPLLRALEALPASQRDAVRAHVLGDQPYDVLAARLAVPEATVRKRVSRGLARLRATAEGRRA